MLRKLKDKDVHILFEIYSKGESSKYLTCNPHKDIEDTFKYIEHIRESEKQENYLFNVISDYNDNMIGFIAFHSFCASEQTCKIGYALIERMQGKGICTKYFQMAIEELRLCSKVHKVIASVSPSNLKSISLLENNKFQFRSCVKNASYNTYTKEYEDRVLYEYLI